jgi:hypothetical protein
MANKNNNKNKTKAISHFFGMNIWLTQPTLKNWAVGPS